MRCMDHLSNQLLQVPLESGVVDTTFWGLGAKFPLPKIKYFGDTTNNLLLKSTHIYHISRTPKIIQEYQIHCGIIPKVNTL
jgi:hypothetical protein